jgi:starch-binding outer membrane protein, SusD/RagB family
MRKFFILLFSCSFFLCNNSRAQNMGIGTTLPDSNAILDISSSSKGVLIPRMDSVQRKSIPPTKGLLVYDSTYSSFWYHNGTGWLRITAGAADDTPVQAGSNVGDMLYWNGTAWVLVPVGLPGQALVLNNAGLPRWGASVTDTSSATGNAYFFPSGDNSAYKAFVGLLYARLAAIETGTTGRFIPNNEPDYDFIRSLWMLQETPTDEAAVAWTDAGVQPLNQNDFTPNNPFLHCFYKRLKDIIENVNSFLMSTTEQRLNEINTGAAERSRIVTYRAEARFLRALAYYYAIDIFGGFEFITENVPAAGIAPSYINRNDLFAFTESELLAIDADLLPARTNEYGRADKATAWMLLAKLYLNAAVYTGTSKYTECLTNLNKIINTAQYSLSTEYRWLFLADNRTNNAQEEIIFPIVAEGKKLPTFGNTTFIVHAATGGSMVPADYGIDMGWFGLRTRRECANILDATGAADTRNFLYKNGQAQTINNLSNFNEGYGITKFRNKNANGSDSDTSFFVSTDFPLFRLADVWLMYAESVLRGGSGGNINMAVTFMNFIRGRSGAAGISSSDLTLNYIFEERTRELYWEGHRRSDLIRFGRFSGNSYLWQWKGGALNGVTTPSFTNLYPLPASILLSNGNLVQNAGY